MSHNSNTTTLLIELPYIGSLSFHAIVLKHGHIYIEACENFQKATYRNRAHIAGPNGLERLSLPINEGRGLRSGIKDVALSFTNRWPKLHWGAITAAYGRSPYFEYYAPELKPIFASPCHNLFDFNWAVMQTTWRLLNMKPNVSFTQEFYKNVPDGWTDARGFISPRPDKDRSMELVRMVEYYQVFQDRNGFKADLCAWDLLFNEGPNAQNILKQMSR